MRHPIPATTPYLRNSSQVSAIWIPERILLRKKMIFNVHEAENIAGFPNPMDLRLHRGYKKYMLQYHVNRPLSDSRLRWHASCKIYPLND
jgi:hypothetical protein